MHLDLVALLRTFDTPVADMVLRIEEMMLAPGGGTLPGDESPPTDEDHARFLAECDDRIAASIAALERGAAALPQGQLLSVPFFLGQPDWRRRTVSPGPNEFDYELGLLAQCRSEVSDSWSFEHFDGILHALRLARSVRLLHQLKNLRRDDSQLAAHFSTAWLFERGRFPGLYDLLVGERLRTELAHVGVTVGEPRALRHFVSIAVMSWSPVYARFFSELDAGEFETLCDLSILSGPEFGQDLQRRIIEASQELWIPAGRLAEGLSKEATQEVSAWLELATACLPLGTGEPLAAYGVSPLQARPIVRDDRDNVLLLAPHRFDTDLTDFLNAAWTEEHGESYFRARARVNESTAMDVLMSLPGAIGISGGKYPGPESGEVRECDGVVVWRGLCFVIEAKGGFIPIAARRGDDEAARSAIRDSIGEAYYQAARLIRTVVEAGELELVSGVDRLLLRASELARFHVLVPVADDFGKFGVRVDLLEGLGLLPAGATPLVAAPQELMLLRDVLTSGIDWAGYLEFREEIIAERPPIAFVDEHEVLGAFVAGVDPIHRTSVSRKATGNLLGPVQPAPILQRHVDAWMSTRFGPNGALLDPQPPPPRRHRQPVQDFLTKSLLNGAELLDVAIATVAGRSAAEAALASVRDKVSAKPRFSVEAELTVVEAAADVPLRILRKLAGWRRAKSSASVWLVVTTLGATPRLLRAWRRPGREHAGDRLLPSVSWAGLVAWTDEKHAKRHGGFDPVLVAALEADGMAHATAVGVVRAGLEHRVRAVSKNSGVPLEKAAALWLNELTSIADQRGLVAVGLPATDIDLGRVLTALKDGSLPRARLGSVLGHLLDGGDVLTALVDAAPATSPLSFGAIAEDVIAVLAQHPDLEPRLMAGDRKALVFTTAQVVRVHGAGVTFLEVSAVLAGAASQLGWRVEP